mmetsp:Transcript_10378/g.11917  ORF Transcript_10378/g.11917 Transcript_10378/m.11917 type:complete len:262 (-) Transcript_10378:1633-2418(-)
MQSNSGQTKQAGNPFEKLLRYFANDVILGSGYPWELLFLHAVSANVSWRKHVELARETRGKNLTEKRSWLLDPFCAYLCHAFGGSTLRDLSMGQTPSLFGNPDVPGGFFLAYLLVNNSPFDFVYKAVNTPKSPIRLIVTAYEAVDCATTVFGSVEKAKRLFPESPLAPFLAGMIAGLGGSVFRYIERRFGRNWDVRTELSQPTVVTRRTLLYTIVYMQLREVIGWKDTRLYMTIFHVIWSLLQEITGRSLDFTRHTISKLL